MQETAPSYESLQLAWREVNHYVLDPLRQMEKRPTATGEEAIPPAPVWYKFLAVYSFLNEVYPYLNNNVETDNPLLVDRYEAVRHWQMLFDHHPASAIHSTNTASIIELSMQNNPDLAVEMSSLLATTGLLHDIGKRQISVIQILDKVEQLTAEEWEIIHEHDYLGEVYLNENYLPLPFKPFHVALTGNHHPQEAVDNYWLIKAGYSLVLPQHAESDQVITDPNLIMNLCRLILVIADSVDAGLSPRCVRPYRNPRYDDLATLDLKINKINSERIAELQISQQDQFHQSTFNLAFLNLRRFILTLKTVTNELSNIQLLNPNNFIFDPALFLNINQQLFSELG